MLWKMNKILMIMILVLIASIVLASFGIAYAGGVRGLGLLGGCFFLTFGILIVLGQLIPATILLTSLIGAGFSFSRKNEFPIRVT